MQNKKITAFILLVLWMAVIFYFSAQIAEDSSAQSGGIVEVIKSFVEKLFSSAKDIDASSWDRFETLLRKLAHGFIYFVLGILCTNYTIRCTFKHKRTGAAVICFLYAVSDEIHQLFVPGRSGQISDVLVDFSGSVIGILCFCFIYKFVFDRRMV